MAALEARLEEQGAPVEAAVQAFYNRLLNAPTNMHQATVFAMVTDDPADAALKRWSAAGFAKSCVRVALGGQRRLRPVRSGKLLRTRRRHLHIQWQQHPARDPLRGQLHLERGARWRLWTNPRVQLADYQGPQLYDL